ncbi:H-NS family nucleoid-associated regulatory protein [Paraglaciecola sp.]|uniref:H-NS family histone-like protein n=1 Tax=Paraglaciecola sp. TaxID=1920173 RepID=UPI0030F3AE79
MSEFLAILTHGRRLQGAVKELTVSELEVVAEKLNNIIELKKSKAAELAQQDIVKQAKLSDILKQMQEAGLNVADLHQVSDSKPAKTPQKRPVKYKLVAQNGEERLWTGIGRMPKVFAEALASGKSIEQFLI